MSASRAGLVSLVGAGPGDPDHLTLKAAQRLREADLVLFDALVSPDVVALATAAEHVCVGKRAGRPQTSQVAIHRAMIAAARGGRRVVRLKGGDPFVFGRGGEEALALAEAGIPCEVVPGVTTAIAAPGLAGIPVTHRGVAGGVVILTGADAATCAAALDALPADLLTVVLLMSLGTRSAVATRLLARGWAPDLPAAMLLGAATSAAWTWRGALAELTTALVPVDRDELPGTIVIGRVAGLPLSLLGTPPGVTVSATEPSPVAPATHLP